jgi:diaminohydroxyphosphoribosylaminopyrimidine deaminase/5-amino-6-(5-phosphoribosylamino)uracil reductase
MTHMERALELARSVLGTTSPNPSVGTVVVKNGVEIGWGATSPPGQNHAEINALQQAGNEAQDSTLYTTLEPCCTFGRTPPCTKKIIDAGIARVKVAAIDPNPRVAGKGCAELKSAGIEVSVGEESEAAQQLYEAFAKHIKTKVPFVNVKFAMSLDGKIATTTGDSKWVTGVESRNRVQQMRRESDAVLVGINTVLADDPQLTARDPQGDPLPRQPLRVVVDSRCRTPSTARILRQPGTTLIATTGQSPKSRIDQLIRSGAEVLALPAGGDGRVSTEALLVELGRRDVVSLLVEGGGALLGSLFDHSLVDKVSAFIAPVVVGGSAAASPVEGRGVEYMAQALKLERVSMRGIGPDWLFVGYP